MKISGGNSGYFEKRLIAFANPRYASSRNARRIDSISTTRDQQCTSLKFGLARHVGNCKSVATGAQGEAMDERVLSFHGDRGGGMGKELKPMPLPFASQDSSHQTLGRYHRGVVGQGERRGSPDLHGTCDEISICATTDERPGIELGAGSCKISDFAEGGEVRLEENLPYAKCLEFDPHLAILDHRILKTARPETEVNGEIDSALCDHGYRFDESSQPREQNGTAPDCRHLERCQELEQGPRENRSEGVGP